jgi:hypothetical protein
LGNVTIHQYDGLFSLNDLHKASGGEAHKRPSLWVANQQTQDLAAEISKAGIPALVTKRGGVNGGTYACRELVIAYAAWISAAFHLRVIRVFLAVEAKPAPTLIDQTIGTDGFQCLAGVLEGKVRKLSGGAKRAAKNHIWQQVHKAFSVTSAENNANGPTPARTWPISTRLKQSRPAPRRLSTTSTTRQPRPR